ncbi:response regulator [candidate division KSB1 bacterium]|nr:response regulator [candidate division KSB1 bacterium]
MTRVLIIEDDIHALSGLIELLTSEGYETYGARNFSDASQIIITQSLDIVISDYRLPDRDGNEICLLLKEYQPLVKLFLISALFDRHMFETARLNGVHEIISKPLIVDDLLNKLQRYAVECH